MLCIYISTINPNPIFSNNLKNDNIGFSARIMSSLGVNGINVFVLKKIERMGKVRISY